MSLLASPNRPRGTICQNAVCSLREPATNSCKINRTSCADRHQGAGVRSQKGVK
jgi:hypothetical protein